MIHDEYNTRLKFNQLVYEFTFTPLQVLAAFRKHWKDEISRTDTIINNPDAEEEEREDARILKDEYTMKEEALQEYLTKSKKDITRYET